VEISDWSKSLESDAMVQANYALMTTQTRAKTSASPLARLLRTHGYHSPANMEPPLRMPRNMGATNGYLSSLLLGYRSVTSHSSAVLVIGRRQSREYLIRVSGDR